MNIQKMNDKMIELEEKAEAMASLGTYHMGFAQGEAEGFLKAMELLGYKWMGQLDGGFRRDRQGR